MFCQKCGTEYDSGVCPSCGQLEYGKVFCKWCGKPIDADCVVCPKCGKQVRELQYQQPVQSQPSVVINNSNDSVNTNANINTQRTQVGNIYGARGRMCKKRTALMLCIFAGYFGAHKFYEGKIGAGVLYFMTGGLLLIGVIMDIIALLGKPEYYYPDGKMLPF